MARDMSRSERASKIRKGKTSKSGVAIHEFPGCLGIFPDSGCLSALPWKPSTECCYEETDSEGKIILKKRCPHFNPKGVMKGEGDITEEEIKDIRNDNAKRRR